MRNRTPPPHYERKRPKIADETIRDYPGGNKSLGDKEATKQAPEQFSTTKKEGEN